MGSDLGGRFFLNAFGHNLRIRFIKQPRLMGVDLTAGTVLPMTQTEDSFLKLADAPGLVLKPSFLCRQQSFEMGILLA